MKKENPISAADNFVDEITLGLLKSRDAVFLEALFVEINPYLIRVCNANGIFDQNGNDVIHSTWEKFFTNIEKFEGRSQIRTFICGILFNKIREYRRSSGRISYEEDSEKFMNHSFTSDGWWKVNPGDPHKLSELRESSDLIHDCLEGLTEDQKNVFIMREIEEENTDDICNVLGLNVSNLRVLLFRAKDKLRKCLEGKISST